MRFAWAGLLFFGCGFPTVMFVDASMQQDSTVETDGGVMDTGVVDSGVTDTSADVDTGPPPVTKGCKVNGDCAMTCTGKVVPGPCGCVAYLADSAPPFCDTTCALTGCANKTPICLDSGTCILQ